MEGGESVVIPNPEGNRTTPSVVSFKSGERQVGEVAKRQAITNPDTIQSVKRHMGTDFKVEIDGKEYTPQEVSAIILQHLKSYAEDYLDRKSTRLNSSHVAISYAVFCLKKKNEHIKI